MEWTWKLTTVCQEQWLSTELCLISEYEDKDDNEDKDHNEDRDDDEDRNDDDEDKDEDEDEDATRVHFQGWVTMRMDILYTEVKKTKT